MAATGAEPISAENLREALESYRQGQREVAMAYASVDVGMKSVDGVHKARDMTVADSSPQGARHDGRGQLRGHGRGHPGLL